MIIAYTAPHTLIRSYWKSSLTSNYHYILTIIIDLKNKAYGQLVLLDFDVTTFTSIAYQRHRL